jgi:hypothetical protein
MCSFFYWNICGSENLDDFACIIYDSSFHSTIHFLVLPKLFSEFLVHVFTKLLLFCSNCFLNFLALLNQCCLLGLSQVVVCASVSCRTAPWRPGRGGGTAGRRGQTPVRRRPWRGSPTTATSSGAHPGARQRRRAPFRACLTDPLKGPTT